MRDCAVTVSARGAGGEGVNHHGAFARDLIGRGYAPATIEDKLALLRAFERWLLRRRRGLYDLDERTIDVYVGRRPGSQRGHGRLTLREFLAHLRVQGMACSPARDGASPLEALVQRYERYLCAERGLCATTVHTQLRLARRFLSESVWEDGRSAPILTAADVSTHLRRHARAGSPGSAKLLVCVLRTLLRFLFQQGDTSTDLSAAVLTVRDWRLVTIPKFLSPHDVERVLAACPRDTPKGRRDRAILLLLARLGMRAGEVVGLELDDIDWRAGTLTVRGTKGLRQERLPLPADVGRALAQYLRRDRTPGGPRRVFLRMRAPRAGFAGPGAVTTLVGDALTRAGLHPAVRGAHLLRHSLATHMLRSGASLAEIGEVLRHRAASTTEIYAKVDLPGLRTVVHPWLPIGGGQ